MIKILTGLHLIFLLLLTAACVQVPASTANPAPLPPIVLAPAVVTLSDAPTSAPTEIPTSVSVVGRILSSTSVSLPIEKLHAGQDGLWYWFEEANSVARADWQGKELINIQIKREGDTPYGNPKDMAVDGKSVWVTDTTHNGVVRIDPTTSQIVDRITLKPVKEGADPIYPFGLALDGNTLWVSDFDQGLILRVDVSSKQVVATISDVNFPEGIAVSPGAVWVVQHRSNSIVRIDPMMNKVVATVDIPGPSYGGGRCGMCIDWIVAGQDAIWVPLDNGNGVARIDPKNNQVVATIPLKMSIRNLALGDKAVWATGSIIGSSGCNQDIPGVLVRIDPATNTEVGRMAIPCAFSVAIGNGDVWVGTAGLSKNKLYRIKPDQ